MPKHVVNKFSEKMFKFLGNMIFAMVVIVSLDSTVNAKNNSIKTTLPPIDEILSDRILGDPNAPVTVIEYASMTCPHCAEFHSRTYNSLKKEYVNTGKVKFIYRDFPLDRLALAAAMMARCAPKERYYAIVEIIFRTQKDWATVADPNLALSRIGLLLGISKKKYKACIGNKKIFEGVMKIRSEGDKKFNIQSTPSIIINEKTFRGELSIDRLRPILDAELSKSRTQ